MFAAHKMQVTLKQAHQAWGGTIGLHFLVAGLVLVLINYNLGNVGLDGIQNGATEIRFTTRRTQNNEEETTTTPVTTYVTPTVPTSSSTGTVKNITGSANASYLPSFIQCGVSSVRKPDSKIVGGINSTVHSWPWIAALGYKVSQVLYFLIVNNIPKYKDDPKE